jgi:hypothetical protein
MPGKRLLPWPIVVWGLLAATLVGLLVLSSGLGRSEPRDTAALNATRSAADAHVSALTTLASWGVNTGSDGNAYRGWLDQIIETANAAARARANETTEMSDPLLRSVMSVVEVATDARTARSASDMSTARASVLTAITVAQSNTTALPVAVPTPANPRPLPTGASHKLVAVPPVTVQPPQPSTYPR